MQTDRRKGGQKLPKTERSTITERKINNNRGKDQQ